MPLNELINLGCILNGGVLLFLVAVELYEPIGIRRLNRDVNRLMGEINE